MEQFEDGIIRLEAPELEDFIKTTVDNMVEEREKLEKLEDYDRLVAEIKDMRKKIEDLETQAIRNAKSLPVASAMKSEDYVDTVEKVAKKKKDEPEKEYDEDGNEIMDAADMKIKKMETEINELKSSPLYKAQQVETTVEKTETESTGLLGNIISTHYGGN